MKNLILLSLIFFTVNSYGQTIIPPSSSSETSSSVSIDNCKHLSNETCKEKKLRKCSKCKKSKLGCARKHMCNISSNNSIRRLGRMKEHLNLSDNQYNKIKNILEIKEKKRQKLTEKMNLLIKKIKKNKTDLEEEIKKRIDEVLTEKQRLLLKERKARLKESRSERRKHRIYSGKEYNKKEKDH